MRKSLFFILSFILTATGLYAQTALAAPVIYRKSHSLPAKTHGAIKLRLGRQDVAITTHSQKSVKITVTLRSNSDSRDEQQKLIKTLVPTIAAHGKNILIQSRKSNGNGPSFNFFGLHFNNVTAKVAIVMPADMNLDFNLGSGDFKFDADKASTTIHGRSGSGDVSVRSASHEIDFHTGSGDQHIELAQSARNAKLEAGSGDIVLTGGAHRLHIGTGSGDIRATGHSTQANLRAGSGDVEISDLTGDLQVSTGSGNVIASWSKLNPRSHVSAEAGSGDVHLTLPAGAALRGSLSANSGDIDSEFPGSSSDHGKHFELSGGRSAVPVDVQTGSGDIDLEKRG